MPQVQPSRERILASARRLFHERGYTAVGVADICAKAGVVKGSFYHFFPSKEDLLDAVLRKNWSGLAQALAAFEQDPGPARGKIQFFFDRIIEHARMMHTHSGSIYGCNIGVMASELAATQDADAGRFRAVFEQWRAVLQRWVEAGVADGSISSDVRPAPAAAALLASIQGMSVLGRSFNDADMLAEIADLAMAQV
ncbi:MAG: TetR/AcrR family transcriptional regulator, partial [Xanthomonadales bacterium]|nr:TetR/AcrR family transcriptional regulator [Xanthomonadales bacterium]